MDQNSYGTTEEGLGSKIKNNIVEFIEFIAIVLAILVVVRFLVAEPHKVSGNSMVPNFHDKDYIITNKLYTRFGEPKRGDVIILTNPRNRDQVFIKRVIGLPGERVKIVDGRIHLNGQILPEPYLPAGLRTPPGSFLNEGEEVVIPDGQYFVVGDNRTASSDSREWGPLNKDLIIGSAFIRYWPIDQFTFIQNSKASDN